jgi:hypothetical protein
MREHSEGCLVLASDESGYGPCRVSVQDAGPEDIQVYAKVDNECFPATMPLVSIERVE